MTRGIQHPDQVANLVLANCAFPATSQDRQIPGSSEPMPWLTIPFRRKEALRWAGGTCGDISGVSPIVSGHRDSAYFRRMRHRAALRAQLHTCAAPVLRRARPQFRCIACRRDAATPAGEIEQERDQDRQRQPSDGPRLPHHQAAGIRLRAAIATATRRSNYAGQRWRADESGGCRESPRNQQ